MVPNYEYIILLNYVDKPQLILRFDSLRKQPTVNNSISEEVGIVRQVDLILTTRQVYFKPRMKLMIGSTRRMGFRVTYCGMSGTEDVT